MTPTNGMDVKAQSGCEEGRANRKETEEPLLTIACLSDLHNQGTLLTELNTGIRGTIKTTLSKIAETEKNVDAVLIGGDVSSDQITTKAKLTTVLNEVNGAINLVSPRSLWITGNHDYNAGEGDEKYNSADYYSIMKKGIGELSAENALWETYKGKQYLLAYHYVIEGFDFICVNSAYEDLEGGLQHYNYKYTDETVIWVAQKLEKIGAEKTVFVMGHFPFRDSNSLSSADKGLAEVTDKKLKQVFTQYPNVIYLYGHDHGKDNAYIRTETEQRVTEYDSNGKVINAPESTLSKLDDDKVWRFIPADGDYYLKNVGNGNYLGVAENLTTLTQETKWTVIDNGNGTFQIVNADTGDGNGVYYSTNSNTFSFSDKQNPQTVELFEKIEEAGRIVYKKAFSVENNKEYVIVANQTKALTNTNITLYATNDRMAAIQVNVISGKETNQIVTNLGNANLFTITPVKGKDYYYIQENVLTEGEYRYLGYNSSNLNLTAGKNYSKDDTARQWTIQKGNNGTFLIENNYCAANHDNLSGLHIGTGGRYSMGQLSDINLYEAVVKDGQTVYTQVTDPSEIHSDAKYVIAANYDGVLYALRNEKTGSGTARRWYSDALSVDKGTEVYIEEYTDDTQAGNPDSPSFISAFMGSMRYYNNSIDGWVNESDSKVVQALIIYVYSDRVELHMKNYGTGNGGAQELTPYISYRKVVYNEQEKITCPVCGGYFNGSYICHQTCQICGNTCDGVSYIHGNHDVEPEPQVSYEKQLLTKFDFTKESSVFNGYHASFMGEYKYQFNAAEPDFSGGVLNPSTAPVYYKEKIDASNGLQICFDVKIDSAHAIQSAWFHTLASLIDVSDPNTRIAADGTTVTACSANTFNLKSTADSSSVQLHYQSGNVVQWGGDCETLADGVHHIVWTLTPDKNGVLCSVEIDGKNPKQNSSLLLKGVNLSDQMMLLLGGSIYGDYYFNELYNVEIYHYVPVESGKEEETTKPDANTSETPADPQKQDKEDNTAKTPSTEDKTTEQETQAAEHNATGAGHAPETGDQSPIMLICILLLSAATIAFGTKKKFEHQ